MLNDFPNIKAITDSTLCIITSPKLKNKAGVALLFSKKGREWKSVTIGFSLFILPDASLFWIFKTVVRVYCYTSSLSAFTSNLSTKSVLLLSRQNHSRENRTGILNTFWKICNVTKSSSSFKCLNSKLTRNTLRKGSIVIFFILNCLFGIVD